MHRRGVWINIQEISILVQHDIDIARTHNLLDLNNAIKKLGYNTPLSDEDTVFLHSIYRSRYPFDAGTLPYGEPTEKDAEKAVDIAKQMTTWCLQVKTRIPDQARHSKKNDCLHFTCPLMHTSPS